MYTVQYSVAIGKPVKTELPQRLNRTDEFYGFQVPKLETPTLPMDYGQREKGEVDSAVGCCT